RVNKINVEERSFRVRIVFRKFISLLSTSAPANTQIISLALTRWMLLKANRFQFGYQNARQDQPGAQNGSGGQCFPYEEKRNHPSHDGFERKDKRRGSSAGHLLRPRLYGESERCGKKRRNQQRQPQNRTGMKERLFQPPKGGEGERRRRAELPNRQRLERGA